MTERKESRKKERIYLAQKAKARVKTILRVDLVTLKYRGENVSVS